MKKQAIKYSLLFFIFNLISANCYYKAPEFWENPYWGEPIIATDWMTDFVTKLKSGSTEEGLDCGGKEANILQIYGPIKLSNLTKGVPSSILNRYPTSPINNVWMNNLSREFGNIRLCGWFRSTSLNFYLTQQLTHGLFIGSFLQIEDNRTNKVQFKDSTRVGDLPSTISKEEWQIFTNSLFKNLERYGICMPNEINKAGLARGDLFFGWARNFTNTCYLDFVDFTGVFGISWPSGTEKNSIFNLNHNLGRSTSFIISARAAIGLWDWLTIGMAVGTELYKSYCENIPMKTDAKQSGLIKLAKGMAKIEKKHLTNINFFLKADNFYKKFSLIFAYQHTKQNRTWLEPRNTDVFNYDIVNSDCALNTWAMSTINFCIDYEFSTPECPSLPKIGIFFDLPMDGYRIFKTKQSGLGISIKTEW